jgi:hypothetical protein
VQIIVLLKQEAADVFARAPQMETAVNAMVRGLGYSMAPVHPGTKSDALRRQFVIRAPEGTDVEALLSKLRAHPEVDGAYVKPMEELPEGPAPTP